MASDARRCACVYKRLILRFLACVWQHQSESSDMNHTITNERIKVCHLRTKVLPSMTETRDCEEAAIEKEKFDAKQHAEWMKARAAEDAVASKAKDECKVVLNQVERRLRWLRRLSH